VDINMREDNPSGGGAVVRLWVKPAFTLFGDRYCYGHTILNDAGEHVAFIDDKIVAPHCGITADASWCRGILLSRGFMANGFAGDDATPLLFTAAEAERYPHTVGHGDDSGLCGPGLSS
jgi:hypothetical protein